MAILQKKHFLTTKDAEISTVTGEKSILSVLVRRSFLCSEIKGPLWCLCSKDAGREEALDTIVE